MSLPYPPLMTALFPRSPRREFGYQFNVRFIFYSPGDHLLCIPRLVKIGVIPSVADFCKLCVMVWCIPLGVPGNVLANQAVAV